MCNVGLNEGATMEEAYKPRANRIFDVFVWKRHIAGLLRQFHARELPPLRRHIMPFTIATSLELSRLMSIHLSSTISAPHRLMITIICTSPIGMVQGERPAAQHGKVTSKDVLRLFAQAQSCFLGDRVTVVNRDYHGHGQVGRVCHALRGPAIKL